MNSLDDVTVLITNYKTYELTAQCVSSLLTHYPEVNVLLIDNGSQDESTAYIQRVSEEHENVKSLINEQNRYHGPAMDQGIRVSNTRYVFTLDSDCEIIKKGLLERMVKEFEEPTLYAIGRLVYMDRYGYETTSKLHKRIKYVHPYAMLLDKQKYLCLKRFVHHGSPCIQNMKDAQRSGYKLMNFPLHDFIFHHGRGTCSKYGYGLGLRTTLELILHWMGIFS